MSLDSCQARRASSAGRSFTRRAYACTKAATSFHRACPSLVRWTTTWSGFGWLDEGVRVNGRFLLRLLQRGDEMRLIQTELSCRTFVSCAEGRKEGRKSKNEASPLQCRRVP